MADVTSEEIQVKKGAIHCAGCETTIEQFLARVPGVQEVKASEKAQSVRVTWDTGSLSGDQVRAKLDELGYPVER
jgi:copper chaperone CopZ